MLNGGYARGLMLDALGAMLGAYMGLIFVLIMLVCLWLLIEKKS